MKLKELAKKPQLVKVTLDNEDIVERYGEPVDFWIYDRYEMDLYLKLMHNEEKDFVGLSQTIKDMVMDEDGSPIFSDGEIIPADVLTKMVEEVIGHLGNSITQTSAA
jgi:hypothetical protein